MNNIRPIIRIFLLLGVSFSLSGCLVMMGKGGAKFDRTPQKQIKAKVAKSNKVKKVPHIYAMRGLLGIFSTGMDTLAKKTKEQLHYDATSMSYLESKKLIKHITNMYFKEKDRNPIILVGHSFGADEQINVAKRLNQLHIPVEAIIAVDNTKRDDIPENVKVVYNVMSNSSQLEKLMFGWGSLYKAKSNHTKIYNINIYKDLHIRGVSHIAIDKSQPVQSYLMSIFKQHAEPQEPHTSAAKNFV